MNCCIQAFWQLNYYFIPLAGIGYLFETKHLRVKIVFIPYYFCVMNYAVLAGILRFFQKQTKCLVGKKLEEKMINDQVLAYN